MKHPLSIAPMMDRTDRHYRFMMRLISRHTLLYTEMITANALIFGDTQRHLEFNDSEHPVSLQLGGDDPAAMARAARLGQDRGYDEININVGCPSDRVKNGNFGACLMKQPELVARIVKTMQDAVSIPVTVKHRIGVDDLDSWDHMRHFVDTVAQTGCTRFTVHARKAWLQGLSPKENREIPPLRHPEVWRLKAEFPHLTIETNGGITSLDQVEEHLQHIDAVMIGRAAYENPWLFQDVDRRFYHDSHPVISRDQLIQTMTDYTQDELKTGTRLAAITRHLVQLFHAEPGARAWRRHLSENTHTPGQDASLIPEAWQLMQEHAERIKARTLQDNTDPSDVSSNSLPEPS